MMESSNYFIKRVVAYTIDIFLASIFTTIVYFLLIPLMLIIPRYIIMEFANSRNLIFDYVLLVLVFYFIQEIIWAKTIGKRIMGLVVVDMKLNKPNVLRILIRTILRIVDMFMVVGLIPIFFTEKNQRLGELLSGTYVIERSKIEENRSEEESDKN